MKWSRTHSIVAGAALIAVTNAVALIGAAYNRSETDSALRLSQRELAPHSRRQSNDNSGMALTVDWRVLPRETPAAESYRWSGRQYGVSPAWLDRAKMDSLGFDTTVPDNPDLQARTFARQLSRDVFLVLEMDGPAYQLSRAAARAAAEKVAALARKDSAKEAKEIVDEEENVHSRLFVVDAGLDRAALRAKYPDRSKYAIVGGRVDPAASRHSRPDADHAGSVSALHASAINVPVELRPVFEGADNPYRRSNSRPVVFYDATVHFGKRLEPWLAAAARKPGG